MNLDWVHEPWSAGTSILFWVVLLVIIFGVFPLALGWWNDRRRTK